MKQSAGLLTLVY